MMRYTIVDIETASSYGFKESAHRTTKGYMILNCNELSLVDSNIEKAAAMLGGELYNIEELNRKINEL